MIIRKAKEKDIPRIIELLGQVLQIHADIRPDIFIPGTTKYTVEELKQGVTLRSLQNKIEEKDFETIKRAYNYLKSEEKYRRIKNSNEQIESKLEKLREL